MALDSTLAAVVRLIRDDPAFDVRIDGKGESGSSIGWATDSGHVRISRLAIARQGQDEQRLAAGGVGGLVLRERVFGNRTLRLQFACETNAQTWASTAEEMADDLRAGLIRQDVADLLWTERLGQPRCTDVRSVPYRDAHGDWRSAAIFEAVFPWSRLHAAPEDTTTDRIASVEYTGDADGHALGPETVGPV